MVRLHNKIFYYLKGADAVMQSKISASDAHFMGEACLDLANEGLRTLVVAVKELSADCNCWFMKTTPHGRRNIVQPALASKEGRKKWGNAGTGWSRGWCLLGLLGLKISCRKESSKL